ncbi:piggyBac transposable element-derived protein 4-like [Vespula squamosa]|uniref:PiggyBac transposable element-derived protein 4-like n=1 Tax=Vespula squamosa TaxID=30214 RepID=A0ABD2BDM5_VESSQ
MNKTKREVRKRGKKWIKDGKEEFYSSSIMIQDKKRGPGLDSSVRGVATPAAPMRIPGFAQYSLSSGYDDLLLQCGFWLASDTNNKYIINGFPYLGKEETRPSSIPLGKFVVLELVEPFTRCWRHVTTDNFFTSASLPTKLLAKRTTSFRTIRSDKRLPKLTKSAKDELERFSTILYKSSDCTLTIYKFKPTKKVTIPSPKHKRVQIRLCKKKKNKTTKT